MKKSVAIIIIFAALAAILWTFFGETTTTGMVTILELPEPPPVPGMQTEQATPELQKPATVQIETTKQPATIENRVTNLEKDVSTVKNRVDALDVAVKNTQEIANKPLVEKPMFTETIKKLSTRTILAITLATLSAILVLGVIINIAITRIRTKNEELQHIRNYMSQYGKLGYTQEELKRHLEASGWNQKIIENAMR